MSSVGSAVKENFKLLCLAVQCDLLNLPATEKRLKVMGILSRIEALTDELDRELKP
jgi:hypothetical protein